MNMQAFYQRLSVKPSQEILLRCGAVSYCVYQLTERHKKAKKILNAISLVQPEVIASLLDEVITPVNKLLEAAAN
jgi:hypothetical protein